MLQERNGNTRVGLAGGSKGKPLGGGLPPVTLKENRTSGPRDPAVEPKEDRSLIPCETRKIRRFYLDEMMEHEFRKTPLAFRCEFLRTHKVTAEIRARMVR